MFLFSKCLSAYNYQNKIVTRLTVDSSNPRKS